jgi:hypothetical protein
MSACVSRRRKGRWKGYAVRSSQFSLLRKCPLRTPNLQLRNRKAQLFKKQLKLEATKKDAATEKERLKNAVLKEKEEKRKEADIERLAKQKKDEAEKKRVAEAKRAATAEKLKQRLEREKARTEARKAATDKLVKERAEKNAPLDESVHNAVENVADALPSEGRDESEP